MRIRVGVKDKQIDIQCGEGEQGKKTSNTTTTQLHGLPTYNNSFTFPFCQIFNG